MIRPQVLRAGTPRKAREFHGLQRTGRIYAEKDGTLVAEITFPEQDGVAVIDHTFVDDSLRGQGGGVVRAAVARFGEQKAGVFLMPRLV